MYELQVIDEREILGKLFRVYGDFENLLFLAKDVAEWIDYAKTSQGYYDVSNMLKTIDNEEKLLRKIFVSGQNRNMWFLTEDGFYEVCMQSTKPNAKIFKKEVKKILKTIRKTGMYMSDNVWDTIMNEPEKIGELLINYGKVRQENENLKFANKVQEQQIIELQPKALYYDLILQCKDLLSTTMIAKDYGMAAKGFNKMLHEFGIQYNQSGVWFLYQKYAIYGYTQTKTNAFVRSDGTPDGKPHMYWTQKGRIFLYNFLKDKGVLPTIEQEEVGA